MAQIIEIKVADSTKTWLELLKQNGLYSIDANGQVQVDSQVSELIDGMHEALAGGKVKVRVQQAGDQQKKAQMSQAYQTALQDTGQLSLQFPNETLWV